MILDNIVEKTKERVCLEKAVKPFEEVKCEAIALGKEVSFQIEAILQETGMHMICEVKKASPSKGVIAEDFPYLAIAKEYEAAGASIISCLTEPYFFQGCDQYLRDIKEHVHIPVLRKDFIIDEYQLYQSRILGADMVLLIVAILSQEQLTSYLQICEQLGLRALVEVHDEDEMQIALQAKATIIGVNNRNLKDFSVDVNNSIRLRKLAPSSCVFVAESGIKTSDDIRALYEAGVNAVLVGETLMRSFDKAVTIKNLLGECR